MRYVNHFIFHLIHCIVGLDGKWRWIREAKNGNGGKGINSGIQTIYDKDMFDALANEIDNNQDMVWTLDKMQLFLKNTLNFQMINYLQASYTP